MTFMISLKSVLQQYSVEMHAFNLLMMVHLQKVSSSLYMTMTLAEN